MQKSFSKERIIPLTLVVISFLALHRFSQDNMTYSNVIHQSISPPPLSHFPPEIVKIAFLGFDYIYDDFILVWTMQSLLGDDTLGNADKLWKAVEVILPHQPKAESLYLAACFVFVDLKRPEHCQKIVLAGLKAFPQSWRLPMTQGFVHAFVSDEPAQAAAFYSIAASRKRSPPYVKNLAAKLINKNKLSEEDINASMSIVPNHLRERLKQLFDEKRRK